MVKVVLLNLVPPLKESRGQFWSSLVASLLRVQNYHCYGPDTSTVEGCGQKNLKKNKVVLSEECFPHPRVFGNPRDGFVVVTVIGKAICNRKLRPGMLNAQQCSEPSLTYRNYSAFIANSFQIKKYHPKVSNGLSRSKSLLFNPIIHLNWYCFSILNVKYNKQTASAN